MDWGCIVIKHHFHIPLGAEYGVEIAEGRKMHYMWIDFLIDPGAMDYLNAAHKPIL